MGLWWFTGSADRNSLCVPAPGQTLARGGEGFGQYVWSSCSQQNYFLSVHCVPRLDQAPGGISEQSRTRPWPQGADTQVTGLGGSRWGRRQEAGQSTESKSSHLLAEAWCHGTRRGASKGWECGAGLGLLWVHLHERWPLCQHSKEGEERGGPEGARHSMGAFLGHPILGEGG